MPSRPQESHLFPKMKWVLDLRPIKLVVAMKITLLFICNANDLKLFIDIGVSTTLSGIVKKKKNPSSHLQRSSS